jgi:hypothetical protein
MSQPPTVTHRGGQLAYPKASVRKASLKPKSVSALWGRREGARSERPIEASETPCLRSRLEVRTCQLPQFLTFGTSKNPN